MILHCYKSRLLKDFKIDLKVPRPLRSVLKTQRLLGCHCFGDPKGHTNDDKVLPFFGIGARRKIYIKNV